jgi:ABC-type multidrug transport system fused ATPase/permease subunit
MNKTHLSSSQLFAVLKGEKKLLLVLVIVLSLQAIISMVQPWPLQIIFDNVILDKPPSPFLTRLAGPLWEMVRQNLLAIMVFLLMAAALFNGTALYVQNIRLTQLIQRVVHRLRVRLFSHIIGLPVAYFDKVGTGEIVSRVVSDTSNVQSALEGGIILVFRSIPTFLGIFVIMLWVDLPFALLTLLLLPFVGAGTWFFGRKVKAASRAKRKYDAQVATVAELATRTHRSLKLLGLKEQEVQRLEEKGLASRKAAVEAGSWQGFYTSSTNVALAAGTALMVLIGVFRIQAGQITPGELLVFMSYLRSMFKPVREVTKYFNKIAKALASNERIEEVMAVTPCDLGVCEVSGASPMPPFHNEIVFDNISFAYEPGVNILENVHFRVQQGQKVAIIGDSGSGKSTLLSLIPRFFDPTEGRILIDGQDVRSHSLQSLREQIAVVPQEQIIFYTTVRENIALGKPDTELSENEIKEAAKKANAHEFIVNLPEGYETELGLGSTHLSGGQAKRILVARALLRDGPVVLLDEPTSGLDPLSEAKVMEAFDRLMERRTIIVITHYLPLIANADLIVVLKNGTVVEQGDHQSLVEKDDIYHHFWQEQIAQLPANHPLQPA